MEYAAGSYDHRSSMTITEDVENQLLTLGFSPATTTASALRILGYTHGVLFQDGDKVVFLNNSNSVATKARLEIGKVYTLRQIGLDIQQNIDRIFSEPIPDNHNSDRNNATNPNPNTAKPVIYLYPERAQQVSVKLDYKGEFTYTYPTYNDGWQVTAHPDGRLVNTADNSEHYYLFWEGNATVDWDFSHGFVVKGSDTETFLREKLSYMGLTPREYNDFITYWVPELSQNAYNLITFSQDQYEELAPLTVTPAPDSVLRVHMVYKACTPDTKVLPQALSTFTREGFTVVEWGGSRA